MASFRVGGETDTFDGDGGRCEWGSPGELTGCSCWDGEKVGPDMVQIKWCFREANVMSR
jgi:hypothetical protein